MVAMGHVSASGFGSPRASGEERFRAELTGRAVWKLLVKGVQLYLPGRSVTPGDVRVCERPGPFPVAAFADETGFGLQLRRARPSREPEREIFVRGEQGSVIGIAIAGQAAAIGSRVVDARSLLRYARKLTYQTLYDPADADSAGSAVRAAKALQDVVFLDADSGFGLGVEVDPQTRRPVARLLVGLDRDAVRVLAYPATGLPAQAVRSQN